MTKLYGYFVLFITLLLSNNAIGQNEAYIFTYTSKMLDNPSFAGFEKGYIANVGYKNQWKNFNSQYLLFSGSITKRMGMGLSINRETIFVQKNTGIFGDFSYNIPTNETDNIYFGIKFGGNFRNVDTHEVKVYNNQGIKIDDPFLQPYSNKFQPNVGIGINYKSPTFFIGIGIPKLLTSKKVELDEANQIIKLAEQFKINILGGYFWNINDDFSLNPYIKYIYIKNQKAQIEIASTIDYKQIFEIGISYRINESVSAFTLINIPNTTFQVGYGYQMYNSDLSDYIGGSHEFMVQYKF